MNIPMALCEVVELIVELWFATQQFTIAMVGQQELTL